LASLAPPPPPSATPLPSATIIAIAIGVGGGVFCICFIVVIILIVKAYRARKVGDQPSLSRTDGGGGGGGGGGEAVSLKSLGVNMSSVRSARPSIATEPVFACSFCPQKFMTSSELQAHMQLHGGGGGGGGGNSLMSSSEYGELSVVAANYDRVEMSTNGDLREVPADDSDLAMTRDSRHAEPALDPSLPGYASKPDEFAKFQIND